MRKDFASGFVPVKKEGEKHFYLIIQEKRGYWGFPKGHLEQGESDLDAAMRELLEETGITDIEVKDKAFACTYIGGEGEKFEKTVKFYLAFVRSGEPRTSKDFAHEILDVKWVGFDEARKLFDFPPTRNVLEEVEAYLLNEKQ